MTTIAQIIPTLHEGGAERTTLEMTQAIVARGWRAMVITQQGRMIDDVAALGGEIVVMPVASKNPWTMAMNARQLKRLASKQGIDLFHARSRAPAWSTYYATSKLNLPFVTTYHGAYGNAGPLKQRYNSVMVRADRVIANSQFTHDQILTAFGTSFRDLESRLTVIARGVDLASFVREAVDPARINRLEQHMGLGPREKEIRILMPARMTSWKGHALAIEALGLVAGQTEGYPGIAKPPTQVHAGQAASLRLIFSGGNGEPTHADGDNAQTTLIEDDQFRRNLRALAVKYGVADLVQFSGHVDDMPAAYGLADIVLMPSTRPEAFGRVAIEAASMGVPVIAANHGGARETVLHEKTGLLVTPNDPDALATAITRLITQSHDQRAQMTQAARTHVATTYSKRAMTEATLRVYDDLLGADAHGEPRSSQVKSI